ncbi:hypothetical protein HK102_006867, partial [Quaeritorhiza haematococci]
MVRLYVLMDILSFLCFFLMLLTFLLLPSHRTFRSNIFKGWLAGASLLYSSSLFWLPRLRNTICIDDVEESTQSNHPGCAASAFVNLFGVGLFMAYVAASRVHLHLNVVWRRNVMERYEGVVHAVTIGYALAFAVTPFGLGAVRHSSTGYCTVEDRRFMMLWVLPLFPLSVPIVILHCVTSG